MSTKDLDAATTGVDGDDVVDTDKDVDAELQALGIAAPPPPTAAASTHLILRRGSEVEVSELVALDLEKASPWVHAEGSFWAYDGSSGTWAERKDQSIRKWITQYDGIGIMAGEDATGKIKTRPLLLGDRNIKAVTSLLRDRWSDANFFNSAPVGMAFANKFIFLDEKMDVQIRPHSPKNKARFVVPHKYGDEGCPRFRTFLREVWGEDADYAEKVAFLRAFVGSCLLGAATRYDCVMSFAGDGGNGKSVLFGIIRGLFPAQYVSAVPPQRFGEPYFTATLANAQINMVAELSAQELVHTSNIKEIVTGEEITSRLPAEPPFKHRPRAGHVYSINPPMPASGDFSYGFYRRFRILKFNKTFSDTAQLKNRDAMIADILEEAPGIMSWCIEGAREPLKSGRLPDFASSEDAISNWKEESDNILRFFREVTDENPDGNDTALELAYAIYREWHNVTGHKNYPTMYKFRDRFIKAGAVLSPLGKNLFRWQPKPQWRAKLRLA